MLGLPRTTDVRSISKVGLSVVTVTFEDDVDLYFARAQVQQRMQDATSSCPTGGADARAAGDGDGRGVPVSRRGRQTALDSLTWLRLTNVQEYMIKPLLRTVPGVAAVNAWGGLEQQFEVLADPAKLAGLRPHAARPRDRAREQQRELRRRLRRGPRRAPHAARARPRGRHDRHRQRRGGDARRRRRSTCATSPR